MYILIPKLKIDQPCTFRNKIPSSLVTRVTMHRSQYITDISKWYFQLISGKKFQENSLVGKRCQ